MISGSDLVTMALDNGSCSAFGGGMGGDSVICACTGSSDGTGAICGRLSVICVSHERIESRLFITNQLCQELAKG